MVWGVGVGVGSCEIGEGGQKVQTSRYKISPRDFPGDPVIKTQHFQCRGTGSNPGWGTKILQAAWNGQEN